MPELPEVETVKNGLKKRITIETLTRFKIDTSNIHLKPNLGGNCKL